MQRDLVLVVHVKKVAAGTTCTWSGLGVGAGVGLGLGSEGGGGDDVHLVHEQQAPLAGLEVLEHELRVVRAPWLGLGVGLGVG